jgi:RHS repeat-associated protein
MLPTCSLREARNVILPGQVFDGQAGLHYNYFRDLDPATGRYIESDPIGLAGGSHSIYIYTNDSPLKHSDITGEGFVDCLKALGELITATAVLHGRIHDMEINAGKPDPLNHPKAIQQAVNRVKNALDKVVRSCACVAGAAAAIAAAEAAIEAAAPCWLLPFFEDEINMWKPRQLPDNFPDTVRTIFTPTAESAKPAFDDDDLNSLHSLISLAVEFRIYLETASRRNPERDDVIYACESILSRVESFMNLNNAYRVIIGSTKSELGRDVMPLNMLTSKFLVLYDEFLTENIFEKKCRLLLDLFKLQLVFAAISFD